VVLKVCFSEHLGFPGISGATEVDAEQMGLWSLKPSSIGAASFPLASHLGILQKSPFEEGDMLLRKAEPL
jgi:hypothetical protein